MSLRLLPRSAYLPTATASVIAAGGPASALGSGGGLRHHPYGAPPGAPARPRASSGGGAGLRSGLGPVGMSAPGMGMGMGMGMGGAAATRGVAAVGAAGGRAAGVGAGAGAAGSRGTATGGSEFFRGLRELWVVLLLNAAIIAVACRCGAAGQGDEGG